MSVDSKMKRSPLQAFIVVVGCGSALLMMLVGCGETPPDCADAQTIGLATRIVQDEVRSTFGAEIKKQPEDVRSQLTSLLDAYASRLKASIVNIVSNGYNSDAKRFTCEGKLTVSSVTGKEFSEQTPYTTQKTQDKESTFVVRIDKFETVQQALDQDFLSYVDAEMSKKAAQQQSSNAAPTSQVAGDTTAQEFEKDNATAKLQVSANQIAFRLNSTVDGGFTCELEGVATRQSPTAATYVGSDSSDRCTAKLELSSNQLGVSTQGCSSACGMRGQGSLDGLYKRSGGKVR
jgi:hypothetical protein